MDTLIAIDVIAVVVIVAFLIRCILRSHSGDC